VIPNFGQKVARKAAGSGIPQVKSIIAGEKMSDVFSRPTLVAKAVGLVTFLGSGTIA
jgi:H+/Cl- antiporter ClcA